MALQSTTTIYIGSQEITAYLNFNIKQTIGKHHTFYLVFSLDAIENKENQILTNTQNFLGETILFNTIPDESEDNSKAMEFKGIITKVESKKDSNNMAANEVVVSGYSTTIIADDGAHYDSFQEMNISDITDKVFSAYDLSKLEINSAPLNNELITYSVQNRESSFAYITRLAAQYGEWVYYDGKKLCIGNNDALKTVELNHPGMLNEYAISLTPAPIKYKFFTNNYINEETTIVRDADVSSNANGLNKFAQNKSDEIFNKETNIHINTYEDAQMSRRLNTTATTIKNASIAKQVKVSGSSDYPAIHLGQVISITDNGVHQGNFRITFIEHRANDNGGYKNYFEGISASSDAYPLTSISAYPKSDTQTAKVLENVDPDGLSRIKVQFPWQEAANQSTPWIRVMTPHSGGDKGFHFIPEVGEEVLVGFEGGNAERPYVMGALYTGKNKPESWQTDANNLKAIRTRSGHPIELNDTEGEEKINIYDNEGSIITFDTQAKSLTINATENIEIGAKNIKIVAEENIDIQAKGNITKAAEGDVSIQSKGATDIQATGDASLVSSGAVSVEGSSDATLKGANVAVEAKASLEMKAAKASLEGKLTEIKGAANKINII